MLRITCLEATTLLGARPSQVEMTRDEEVYWRRSWTRRQARLRRLRSGPAQQRARPPTSPVVKAPRRGTAVSAHWCALKLDRRSDQSWKDRLFEEKTGFRLGFRLFKLYLGFYL